MSSLLTSIQEFVRNRFTLLWSKQFLTFLFFLVLSSIFWAISILNDTYKEEFNIPLTLVNVPDNVIITTPPPHYLHATLEDKGFNLMNLRFRLQNDPIKIDFNRYAKESGYAKISLINLQKQITSRIPSSTILSHLNPQSLEFYFNYGERKKIPIVTKGTISANNHHYVYSYSVKPDSVMVYAQANILDTLSYISTVDFHINGVNENFKAMVPMQKSKGIKIVPDSVEVNYVIDQYVEKTIEVPIQQINFPPNKVLRTFPARVKITCQVGRLLYQEITADDFILPVNYEELLSLRSNQFSPTLKTIPAGVRYVRISPQQVDFVLEDISNNDTD